MHFDVFNGDADGIIALVQLRLANPKNSQLITGVKRDIELLQQVDIQQASSVTVLDISLDKNRQPLTQLLAQGIPVDYFDHHKSGDIPQSEHLTATINTDANTCTSLLVNEYLNNRFVHWAIAAAFGDNMTASAQALAQKHQLTAEQSQLLSELGIYINYNGYGCTIDDLHIAPITLFKTLLNYPDPLTLVNEKNSLFSQLKQAYQEDMQKAQSADVLFDNKVCKVVELADQAWARRVSGVFGNELANASPHKAHAVLTKNTDNSYTVSVRAPLNNKQGAVEVCSQFATGGGRAAAAGINQLPATQLNTFIQALVAYYQ